MRAAAARLDAGDARSRPRSPVTIRVHFGILASFTGHWAATRSHLREVTPGDVATVLEPMRGHRRYNAITALRSLFRFARRRGLIFADATGHLSGGRASERTLLPLTAGQIQAVQQPAVTLPSTWPSCWRPCTWPGPRRFASSPWTTSTSPAGASPSPAAGSRSAGFTRGALLAWLAYRRATWPHTANRHVLVTRVSALGSGPVSADFLDRRPAARHLPGAHPARPHPA